MSDPRRLLDEQDSDKNEGAALKAAVLRSAKGDAPPPHAKKKLLEALKVAEGGAAEASAARSGPAQRVEKRTMFDSVLNRGNVAKSRFGTGATFSVVVHVALLGVAIYISSRPPEEKKKKVDVTFVQAAPPTPAANEPPPPPPPPPPPKRRSSTPKVEKMVEDTPTVEKKPDTIVEAKEEAAEKPVDVAEVTPTGGGDDDDGVEGGVEGGVKGGVVGGVIGGKVGSTTPIPPQNVVIPFGAGMNRPSRTAGRDPVYTKEALAARVEGLMIVRCTINITGAITNCRVIKELPHMKQAVLDALYSHRYTPVVFNGQPVNVDYVFNIKLVLPTR